MVLQSRRYQIAAHVYSYRKASRIVDGKRVYDEDSRTITASLIRINPYGEKYRIQKVYQKRGQQITLFNFELDENGKLTAIDDRSNNIILRRGTSYMSMNLYNFDLLSYTTFDDCYRISSSMGCY